MAYGSGLSLDVFGTAGTDSLGFYDAYGGNGVSLSEGADVANGSYNYGGTAGGIIYANDVVEAQRVAAGYPANGQSLDWNMATLGITRLIDSASRYTAVSKGATAATYAGQNGLTYANGRNVSSLSVGNGLLVPLMIAAALFLVMKK